jgi:uncharacterized membrane protein YjjP (DUF1212 family)
LGPVNRSSLPPFPALPDSPVPGEPHPDAVRFILRLGRALHECGYASHRLESILLRAADRIGLPAQFFTTPTSIFAAFGPLERQRTYLLRVEPGGQDLGRMADIDAVIGDVVRRGSVPLAEGAARIDAIMAGPSRYGPVVLVLAFGVASAASARFLGGGWQEVLIGGATGLLTGLMSRLAASRATLGRVFEPLSAFLVAALVSFASATITPLSVPTGTLAGLIVLIPGLTFTVAMTELTNRHLVAGISRLSGALMLFLAIAFGVALGNQLVGRLAGEVPSVAPTALPGWTEVPALVVATLGFTVLLHARLRDAPWVLLVGAAAIWFSRLGAVALGVELGSFIGALTVGVASNVLSRLRDQPSSVTQVPGILFLVPGSVGVRSLFSMLDQEVIRGVETTFQMLLIGASLVAGILVANVVAPSRHLREGSV